MARNFTGSRMLETKRRKGSIMAQEKGVSRRDFFKGAGVAAAGAAMATAGLGLAGCAGGGGASADAEQWDQEAEVVIVGYGGAGACAAIAAADAGAKVLVLEKNAEDKHLCNTVMSGGIYHSPDPDGDKEALKQYLKAMFSGENLDTKAEGEQSPLFVDDIVEKFAEYSPKNVEFMQSLDPDYKVIERGGAAFPDFPGAKESGYKSYNSTYGKSATGPDYPTLDLPKEDTAAGLAFFNCLKTGIAARAENITIAYETPGKSLIMDDEGAVIGVVATQGDKDIRVKAGKGVILTTGGYEYNEEMRRAFLEGQGITGWAFYGTLSNTGDGIRMGCEAGAQLAKVGKAASRLIWSCPDVQVAPMNVGSITDSVGGAGTIVVNSEGRRFMDETLITKDPSRYFSYKNAVHMDIVTLEFPNTPAYMIIDETKRKAGPLVNTTLSTCGFGIIDWDKDNQSAIDNGWLIKADSIEELAQKIRDTHELNEGRMDPAVLAATMEQYQKMVDTGIDEEFGRTSATKNALTGEVVDPGFQAISTPPFYAMPLVAGGPNTKGGLQADGDRRVIDWNNEPIPRLYTAGEISSCFKFVYQGGGNVTECIVCGRIAGENAAAETAWDAK